MIRLTTVFFFSLIAFPCVSAAGDQAEENRALEAIRQANGYVGWDDNGPLAGKRRVLHMAFRTDVDAVLKQVKYLKHLDTILFHPSVPLSDELFAKFMADAPGLKSVDVRTVSDEVLKIIGKHKKMEVVRTYSAKFTDAGIKHLAGLENLRELHFGGSQVTSKGFTELVALKKLEVMTFSWATDEQMKGVGKITSLKNLDLRGTSVADEGMKEIARLKDLRKLKLFRTQISDDGVKHLASLDNLEYLDLSQTKITDDALTPIGKMKKIHRLCLNKTQITDGGIGRLSHLDTLTILELCDTKITGVGINQLAEMKELRWVVKGGSGITGRDIGAFRKLNKTAQFLPVPESLQDR